MKKIAIIILFLFISLSANADMLLQGEVKYNVDSAREELTNTQALKPQQILFQNNFYDKNFKENATYLLKGNAKLKDREIAFFSDNTYGIIYKKNKKEVFYYYPNGQLMYVELRDRIEYPFKAYKYDLYGNMVNMSLRVSKEETFIYNQDGELIAHWIGNFGYDTKGNVIMTRRYAK